MQFKRRQRFRSNSAEPEAAKLHLNMYIYAACVPLNNIINTTNTDSGVKAAVKNAQALQFGILKSSHIKIIYIVIYAIDSLKSSSFTAFNMKNQSQCRFLVRITTWSVVMRLSSEELANDKICLLAGENIISLKL